MHTWLPDAHTNADGGSVILAGVMLAGTYGLRFGIYLFPEAPCTSTGARRPRHDRHHLRRDAGDMQKDLKRLVAYSSVAHLGFVIGTFALNTEGLSGGLLQMVNHGISTGALFCSSVGSTTVATADRELVASEAGAGLRGRLHGRDVELDRSARPQWLRRGVPARSVPSQRIAGGRSSPPQVSSSALYLLWAYQRVFHGPAEGTTR